MPGVLFGELLYGAYGFYLPDGTFYIVVDGFADHFTVVVPGGALLAIDIGLRRAILTAGDPSELFWFDLIPQIGEQPKLIPHKIDDQSGIGTQFLTTDFNGDGRCDIVVSNRKGVFLFVQSGAE